MYSKHLYKSKSPAARNERGTAAMEFAVLMPAFLALALGVMYFGIGFNTKINLTSSVREGARTLALGAPAAEGRTKVLESASGIDLLPSEVEVISTCEDRNQETAVIKATRPVEYNLFFTHGTWTVTATGVMQCEMWRVGST